MNLVFLGSPGVGKGTYAQVLKDELELPHISTGDILREMAGKDTELGREVKEVMEKGELVSDELMKKLIEARLAEDDCEEGFILDGYPRTPKQARDLEEITSIDHVLNFKADDAVIIRRLSGRLTCPKCKTIFHKTGNKPQKKGLCDNCGAELIQREDDKPEAIKNRIEIYKEKTKPLIDYFRNEELLVEITINKPISEIRQKVIDKVTAYLNDDIEVIGEIK